MTNQQHSINSGFGAATTAREVLAGIDLSGRYAIVTGGYSGIGLETTRALRGAGAEILVPARRPKTAREALAGLDGVTVDELDLGDLDSVHAFGGRVLEAGRPVDILINNAGIMATPEMRIGSGWEAQFATNHLGHYALTNLIWPLLADGGARVVALSSGDIATRRSAGTTSSSPPAMTSGSPTARPRPPTSCSRCTSTSSARATASAPSPAIPEGS